MQYKNVAIGGTFDGLHKGHKAFLRVAFKAGKQVTIGLTSSAYLKRFKPDVPIRSYDERKTSLEKWLKEEKLFKTAAIVPLDNIYGPAILGDFDAIVVTQDSKKNASLLNEVRKERGLTALAIIEVPLVPADDTKPISSTRMRRREIDGEGHLILPDSLRPQLQKPLGRILVGEDIIRSIDEHRGDVVITVGDVTTKTLLDAGHVPNLSVIDNQVNRKPFGELIRLIEALELRTRKVKSGPGYISADALNALEEWASDFRKYPHYRLVLDVNGEEDLLALPVIGHAPEGSIVYYGQPLIGSVQGLVEVTVTREKKREAAGLLGQFAS